MGGALGWYARGSEVTSAKSALAHALKERDAARLEATGVQQVLADTNAKSWKEGRALDECQASLGRLRKGFLTGAIQ
jgi:hypothetical protein